MELKLFNGNTNADAAPNIATTAQAVAQSLSPVEAKEAFIASLQGKTLKITTTYRPNAAYRDGDEEEVTVLGYALSPDVDANGQPNGTHVVRLICEGSRGKLSPKYKGNVVDLPLKGDRLKIKIRMFAPSANSIIAYAELI